MEPNDPDAGTRLGEPGPRKARGAGLRGNWLVLVGIVGILAWGSVLFRPLGPTPPAGDPSPAPQPATAPAKREATAAAPGPGAATAPAAPPRSREAAAPRNEEIPRTDGAPGKVRGRVLDEAGAPLTKWIVELAALAGVASKRRSALTDSAGAFSFADCAPGGYLVIAHEPRSRSSAPSASATAEAGGPEAILRVPNETRASCVVEGLVVDPRGAPAPGAAVAVLPNPSFAYVVPTGADGRFRMEKLVRGTYRIRATSAVHAPSAWLDCTLAAGERFDAGTLALREAGALRIRASFGDGTSAKNPIVTVVRPAGALGEREVVCSARAEKDPWDSPPLAPGDYEVRVTPAEEEGAPVALRTLVFQGAPTEIHVALPRGVRRALVASRPAGAPAVGVVLAIADSAGMPFAEFRSDPHESLGPYAPCLAPGTYAFTLRSEAGALLGERSVDWPPPAGAEPFVVRF